MKRLGALSACILLAAALPTGSGHGPDLCNDGDLDDLDACRAGAAQAAMSWLAAQDDSYLKLEAAAAAGVDPATWPPEAPLLGDVEIPAPDGIAGPPIRRVGAAAAFGYDPIAYPTPSGSVDLAGMLRDNHADVVTGSSTGALSFHLWSLRAAGVPESDDDMGQARQILLSRQQADGGWPCSLATSNPDCTGWAVAALESSGGVPEGAAGRVRSYIEALYDPSTGGYGDGGSVGTNSQTTAWAMTVLHHTGGSIGDATWEYLLSLQDDAGFFWHRDGSKGSSLWVTAEVVPVLHGFHPLPRAAPAAALVPGSVHVGQNVTYVVEGMADAQWAIGSSIADGTTVDWVHQEPGPQSIRLHAWDGRDHHRSLHETTVLNDPPAFASLPDRITTDRVQGIAFDAGATDPEGFPVEVHWTLGGAAGNGTVDTLPPAVGAHVLELEARDPHGGVSTRILDVVVENLRPAIDDVEAPATSESGQEFEVSVQASDPDGDPLAFAWTFASGEHAESLDEAGGFLSLPTGDYDVELTVTDAHGDAVAWSGSLLVAKDAPAAVAPTFTTARVAVEGRNVTVHAAASPGGATVTAFWMAGGRNGTILLEDGQGVLVVPDGIGALDSVRVRASHDGLTVEHAWGPFQMPPVPEPAGDGPEDTAGNLTEDGTGAALDDAATTASASEHVTQDQESPLGLLVPLVSLAAALGKRGPRAPRQRRTGRRS